MSKLENRSELLFLYDVKDTNPNGDPMDENKPRVDEKTRVNIVTDVRLKRTVRDYLHDYKDEEIFVVEEVTKDGKQKSKKERLDELKINNQEEAKKLFDKYVDLRLFGATIAESERRLTETGPVQFRFGRSLHKVELALIHGTTVMPSGEGKEQGTFTEVYVLPYSLIAFYGIVNENAAESTKLQAEDIDLLTEGMWNGTKNLLTRSKVGQMPRLLLQIEYNGGNYHIGDLDKKIKLTEVEDELSIRDIGDVKLDFTELKESLRTSKDKIKRIWVQKDESIDLDLSDTGIPVEEFNY